MLQFYTFTVLQFSKTVKMEFLQFLKNCKTVKV